MARERGEEPALLGVFTTDTHLVVRTWDAFLARITGIAAADALGWKEGTVRSQLHRMRTRFYKLLFQEVAATLVNPTQEAVLEELRELQGLFI